MDQLPSTKPYLLRAIWEWCCDNGLTPYIAVQVDGRTRVPREFVRDGQIVLNLGPDATNKLQMGNEYIDFQARFGGVARELSIPVERISAIYARENGAGMAFDIEDAEVGEAVDAADADAMPDETPEPPEPTRPEPGRPKLQRIK
jgi:stringent starvation protein B